MSDTRTSALDNWVAARALQRMYEKGRVLVDATTSLEHLKHLAYGEGNSASRLGLAAVHLTRSSVPVDQALPEALQRVNDLLGNLPLTEGQRSRDGLAQQLRRYAHSISWADVRTFHQT